MTLKGHPRSLILAPIESAYMTSYSTLIATLVPSCRVLEILELLYAESHFSAPHPYSGENFGVFPLEKTHHVGVEKSERPRLTNGEIIFEEFQPCDHNSPTSQTDGRTDGQTDRRHAIAIPRFALKCIAREKYNDSSSVVKLSGITFAGPKL